MCLVFSRPCLHCTSCTCYQFSTSHSHLTPCTRQPVLYCSPSGPRDMHYVWSESLWVPADQSAWWHVDDYSRLASLTSISDQCTTCSTSWMRQRSMHIDIRLHVKNVVMINGQVVSSSYCQCLQSSYCSMAIDQCTSRYFRYFSPHHVHCTLASPP